MHANQPPALALRTDVDVCVWQPPATMATTIATNTAATAADWRPRHEGTLNAIGYVQASKTQKKYMQCSPDLRTTVICEPQRHCFIYQTGCASASGLTNRRNGGGARSVARNVGQQRLFSTDTAGEIVGVAVDNEVLVLLTDTEVICVQVNA